ncbi:MAG: Gfo/Idh/MocA family oxidoreductase [candidate division KSB1 bacterium]|nr:Gfo/Idh/MocA family oxidoreductase [candidate division KSB1 bacterium]MDZ7272892.1 Gfo/Idh/MocA family oxidoreductase [candidate division KSB1 bacterium]MDZ7284085.1 Gfo/Idh/MocA family oxidoreductase [candidate division KSB1 bacterium]MDZ7297517.1 Gfo/Idh/MocA family oxidoreductase [candidate division KSB1 bacterium]MDZ7308253.1 Gfo/Idh/MocA family oxidoreductase [candidate division KSB1 bacterium]
MAVIRIGVAGVGRLGALHAARLREIAGVELAGVFDVNQQRARQVAAEHGTRAFATLPELLASCEALTIAVPTSEHFATAQVALQAGRHVLIEKPVTATSAQARQLIALAQAHNLILQVGHIERFNGALRALAGFPLAPRFIESHRMASFDPRGTDVAVVLDLMIHDIDIILNLVRSTLTRVDANGVAVVSHEPDIANARLQFANGCVANVTASRISQKKMRKLRLFQRDAYISVDFLQGFSEIFRLTAPEESVPGQAFPLVLGRLDQGARPRQIIYEKREAPEGNALRLELESFARAIRGEAPPPVTGEDGLRALEVASAITEMIKAEPPA